MDAEAAPAAAAAAPEPAPAPAPAQEDEEDERICRYCFGDADEGTLIAPCACSGGQKWVHLNCLRRWQRMVLVEQPTHPAFWKEDNDARHHVCGVCKTKFTCAPPTRFELMSNFTGAEIAALVSDGCVISAHETFSEELEEQLGQMNGLQTRMCGYQHWARGAYLITGVEPDEEQDVQLRLHDAGDVRAFRAALVEGGALKYRGRTLHIQRKGPLEDLPMDADIVEALEALETPATIYLKTEVEVDGGNDHVTAVNLTRPTRLPPKPDKVRMAVDAIASQYPGAADVEIEHFLGGPCDDMALSCCVVPGGAPQGWAVVKDLDVALTLAYSRAANTRVAAAAAMGVDVSHPSVVSGGQSVTLAGLKGRPELNGEPGVALLFDKDSGRWQVRLRNGEAVKVRPGNLDPGDGRDGRVLAFWGDAQWSRTQLLGEIARGHWGLCKASVDVIAVLDTDNRWDAARSRSVYAPVTEMTDAALRQAGDQMGRMRQQRAQREETEPELSQQQRADETVYAVAEHQQEAESTPVADADTGGEAEAEATDEGL